MTKAELNEYTKRAKELESAIYTHENLTKIHEQIMLENIPKEPEKKTIIPPPMPVCPIKENSYPALWFFIILLLIFLPLGIGLFYAAMLFSALFCLTLGGIGVYAAYHWIETYKKVNSEYKTSMDNYNRELDKYRALREEYNDMCNRINEEYEHAMTKYKTDLDNHNENKLRISEKYSEIYCLLTKSLEEHYSQNIIFPKYRNLIAITSISEYLESGRCDALEGASGAYNLYEMELRQNIIIGHLSSIVDNLDQIKSNQYLLYQELQQANKTIKQIAYELRETQNNTKLMAYFSSVTALAAVSPTYTVGVIC